MTFGINYYSLKSSQVHLLLPMLLLVSIIPTNSVFAAKFVDGVEVKSYALRTGETVDSVAHQYNLTLKELKTLNQTRKFTRPFETLSAGDEIDVPSPPPTKTRVKNTTGTNLADKPDHKIQDWLSRRAPSFFDAINTQSAEKYLSRQAQNIAITKASSTIENWLNQYGTAQIGVQQTNKLSQSAISADILLPMYQSPDWLLFTQFGGRNFDDRTTLNLGSGIRRFSDPWMYGVNTFYDIDITGHNRRIGIGAELWSDYLHFSANGYLRLNNWHQSRDFDDYDERPANGFDITASSWLPAYPQLGAKLKYEQYFGNEVALKDNDIRSQAPKAMTVGVNYTPFPLIILGADWRKEKGVNELQLEAQLTYSLGVPWNEQVSSVSVASLRTLPSNRMALVERNNNIVLEYRKQELISLMLPQEVRGRGASQQLVNIILKAKYAAERVEWGLQTEFSSKGGKILSVGKSLTAWLIHLPPWQAGTTNTYTLSASAWDEKGNSSPPAYIKVIVDAGLSARHSHLTVGSGTLNLDQSEVLILTIRDEQNAPVTGLASSIQLPFTFTIPKGTSSLSPSQSGIKLTELKETAPGVYTSTVTAGKLLGTLILNPQIDGIRIASATVEVIAAPIGIQIFRNGIAIVGNPVVGDRLTATPDCQINCILPTFWQWEVETSQGSGRYQAIRGATTTTYIVTTDMQKRRLRVTAQ
ncbi:inverse autotransporter beta domain-containing protein [Providencia stuartii]|uniref:inverse autotransporter beta domain-containing protein n=1 Tax=Providencia TaxID=586 RepID=UPI0027FBDDEC|nr:inverse autotransporter beta domain-containing protein [Providencia sp. 2023EL-00965]ELR5302328.1 inverse autotransporter beta domain-containing protein [Providencia stuartii]MDW7589333.1 inverse autotransporter beta domain-containing protein [Providencia sp. 2023EL-00965]